MGKHVTRVFRKAVRGATASVRQLAEESGYSRVTWDKYLNERPATAAACLALADTLEARAKRFREDALRLREVAGGEAGGEPRPSRRRRVRR